MTNEEVDTRDYCLNRCGRLAVAEQFIGFVGEDEIVGKVCYEATIGECVDPDDIPLTPEIKALDEQFD